MELLKKYIFPISIRVLVYFFGDLLRYIDNFVNDLHDILRVVSSRIISNGNVVFIEKVILIILTARYFFNEVIDLTARSLGVLLRVLVNYFRNDFLQALVEKLHKRNVDFSLAYSVYLHTCLLDV